MKDPESPPETGRLPPEAEARAARASEAMEEIRRTEGAWVAGPDGEAMWLPPDPPADPRPPPDPQDA